jgi:ribosomal protein S18 acetylase RimI-like enzyme
VSANHIHTRRLAPADAALFREIRLESLQSNPEAFASTFEAENILPLAWFSDRLGDSNVFGAFHGSALVGVAGLFIGEGQKKAHKGLLWGMYVRPGSRGAGIGRRLVETVIDFATHRVELIQLAVIRDNENARRLYASLGFVEYGIEKHALKQGGRYYDEVLMAKDLKQD